MKELFKQSKAFRLLLAYQFFSSLGAGIFGLFMLLSVQLIFQNIIYTGIAGFMMTVPSIFSFAVGPVVDKSSKVSIMRLTTLLEFIVLSVFFVFTLQENVDVVFMFTVILIFSCAALFEGPAGRAFLPQIVQKEKIMEANSLIQIVTMAGGIIIAIVLLVTLGEGVAFNFEILYGLSAAFLAIAFVFSLLIKKPTLSRVDVDVPKQNYKEDLIAGAKFVRHSMMLYIIIAIMIKYFMLEIAAVNMPAFADYHTGPQGYIIFSIVGMAGGIASSTLLGMFGKRFKVGQLLLIFFVVAGIARIGFANLMPVSFIGGLVILSIYTSMNSSSEIVFQSLEQTIPPKDMVARVGTLSTTLTSISVAIGALVGGFVGSVMPTVNHVFIYQGIGFVVLGVLIVLLVPGIRKLPLGT